VAIPKVCGIETEYGIQVVNGDPNPIAASSVLINAYAHDVARQQTGWDFEDEAPGNDARGFAREGSMPPQVETHLVNTVLTNGARFYVDHAHPEFSPPNAATPSSASGTTGPASSSSPGRWRRPTRPPTTGRGS
jgi:Pup amidohydrolase